MMMKQLQFTYIHTGKTFTEIISVLKVKKQALALS